MRFTPYSKPRVSLKRLDSRIRKRSQKRGRGGGWGERGIIVIEINDERGDRLIITDFKKGGNQLFDTFVCYWNYSSDCGHFYCIAFNLLQF